ncbi:MAG TPA: DUF4836 family protein [Chitinophagaceae bacterium]|nr:DUF4836 family protein [Chitinophagaceae bacterium]
MKKIFLSLIVIASLAVIISSCKKHDKTGLLIPKDAAMAVHFNAASFSSKLSWDDIIATNWFQKMQTESHDSLARQFLADPAISGMDLKSDFVYFIKMRTNGAYFVIDGKLKDDAAFAAYCKKLFPYGTLSQDGAFNFISRNDNGAVIWNKEHFAFVINSPRNPWNRNIENQNPPTDQKTITIDSVKKYGKDVLSLSNTQTLGTDDHFASLVSEPGDIHMWLDMEKIYTGNNMMGEMLSMMKVSTFFEGNTYALTLNFDNGKITMNGKHYQGKELTKLLKKYPPQPTDAALINRLPSENVMAAFAINFHPEAINETMKIIGMDGMVNLLLGKANLSLDDISKANKGQMLFAWTGVDIKNVIDTLSAEPGKKPVTVTHAGRSPKFIFANAINNKGAFDRLLDFLKENNGRPGSPAANYTFRVKDDWFVAGDSANVAAFLSGNSNAVPFAGRISGHPFGGYIDLQKIISHLAEKNADSSRMAALNASKNMWQDMVVTGGDFTGDAVTFSMEVNLVNKTTNSLKQLNTYMDQVASAFKDRLAMNKEELDAIKADDNKMK